MHSDPLPLPKVFPLTPFWRTYMLLLPILGIVFIILAILMMMPALNDSVVSNIVPMLVLLVLAALLIWLYMGLRSSRLVLSQEGITYYNLFYRMYTPWHNVVGVGSVPYAFVLNFLYKGLLLRERAIVPGKLEDGLRYGVAVIDSKWLAAGMVRYAGILPIAFAIGGRNWQKKELGAYIRQYATQAFGEAPMMSEYSFREYMQ